MSRLKLWTGDLALGVRIALGGGRTSWVRLVLTAVGVGLGVAVLLAAASAPNTISARKDRQELTQLLTGQPPIAGVDPLYAVHDDKQFRGATITGNYVTSGGPRAPLPPGADRVPGDGEILMSPALVELLASPEGELLRPRFPQRVVGTIGQAGLDGPNTLAFVAGDATIERIADNAIYSYDIEQRTRAVDPVIWLLVLVGVVVLLFPVLVFIGISTRLAGPERDRRLAALRLIGTGAQRVRRIAAGEALLGALAGLVVGAAVFLVARQFAESVELFGISVFVSDFTPSPMLAVIIAVSVPVMAVVGALFAMRRTVVEPLGVVRQGRPVNRQLWWRVIPIVLGVAVLGLQAGVLANSTASQTTLAAGICLLLLGIPVLLPWVVERSVGKVRGGAPAWQLAIRRLQMDSGTAARVVGGVAVVLAGGIALQTVMASGAAHVQARPMRATADPNVLEYTIRGAATARFDEVAGAVAQSKGVASVEPSRTFLIEGRDGEALGVLVASCAELQRLNRNIGTCTDGDAFAPVDEENPNRPNPGERVNTLLGYGDDPAKGPQWTVPELKQARSYGIALTPGALRGFPAQYTASSLIATLDPTTPDAADLARNAVGGFGWQTMSDFQGASVPSLQARQFESVRRALLAGSLITLMLAGASLLVLALEQVRARRRPLAVLAATGVPRSTLAWSLLWQNAIPLVLAMVVAVATGAGLGVLLLRVLAQPVVLDFAGMGVLTGASVVLVLLVTVLTLPALRRATGALGLRTE